MHLHNIYYYIYDRSSSAALCSTHILLTAASSEQKYDWQPAAAAVQVAER